MQRLDIRDFKDKVKKNTESVTLRVGDKRQTILFGYKKMGYGDRRYFICPYCSTYVQHLYIVRSDLKCRQCSGVNLYQGIQNCTRGGDSEIAYRMKRYASKHGIRFDFPFDYLAFVTDSRTSKEKFREHLQILQALENMRLQAIAFQERYDTKTFKRVTSGKHYLLRVLTLKDLRENSYDWKSISGLNED